MNDELQQLLPENPITNSTTRSRFWCFTINRFTPSEVLYLRELGRSARSTYLIFGREVGANGTRHLQGYVEFKKRYRFTRAKNLLSSRAHLEQRRATAKQASDYCKKDRDYEEFGTLSRTEQGKRNDLLEIKGLLDQGATEGHIADNYFSKWCIYRRAFRDYRLLKSVDRDFKSEVYIYYGDAGTGKTRAVFEKESDLWVAVDNQLNWFDGYSNNVAALFDDFVGCKISKFGLLLRLLDRYKMVVPVKGGFTNWAPRRIYITSNLHPDDWFLGATEAQKCALNRRITEIKLFQV
jgi:hypothetical protein